MSSILPNLTHETGDPRNPDKRKAIRTFRLHSIVLMPDRRFVRLRGEACLLQDFNTNAEIWCASAIRSTDRICATDPKTRHKLMDLFY